MSSIDLSFSDLSDLESVADDSRFKDDLKELENVKEENVELKGVVQELKENVKQFTVEPEENILTSIMGSWSIVSTIGMKEYLNKWNSSDIEQAVFQVGTQNFRLEEDNTVIIYNGIGISEYFEKRLKLGEIIDNMLMFVEDNKLIEVYFRDDGEESLRGENFVKNGQLHVVTKRFGMNCTRIYEKVGAVGKKEAEAAKKIVELETELEMLKVEKAEAVYELEKLKKTMEEEKIEKEQEIELLNNKISTSLSTNLVLKNALKCEEAKKEALKKELEDKKNESFFSLIAGFLISKLLGKSLQGKNAVQGLADEKTDESTPIQTDIVGKWKRTGHSEIIDFTMKDGSLLRARKYPGSSETTIEVWELDNPTHKYGTAFYAHTFIADNRLVTNINWKVDGTLYESIERRVENDQLTETTTDNKGTKTIHVYQRVM